MALYVDIETPDGERRIPVLNREEVEIGVEAVSMTVVRIFVSRRDDLDERRYRGSDIERVIRNLREGDEVKVTTYPESYGDNTLEIEKGGDRPIGLNEDGERFILLPRFWGKSNQGDGQPWMRTSDGWDSRGEIEEVEILSLADE